MNNFFLLIRYTSLSINLCSLTPVQNFLRQAFEDLYCQYLSTLVICIYIILLSLYIFFFNFPGNSPINPFLTSIAKQRGYSPLIVGDTFTFLLLLNVVVKPLTGYITDKWKCRKIMFIGSILLNGLLTPTLYLIPGARSLTGEISDVEAFGSWTFWLFTLVVTLRMILFMIGEVLQETICMRILSRYIYIDQISGGSKTF